MMHWSSLEVVQVGVALWAVQVGVALALVHVDVAQVIQVGVEQYGNHVLAHSSIPHTHTNTHRCNDPVWGPHTLRHTQSSS